MGTIINIILALPKLIGAVKALVSMWQEIKKNQKAEAAKKLKQEIENAKTEDDFRRIADKL